ncbi:hypothetical protein BDV28DRAFT_146423 [Aspergillus coremiiformis]|uniref:Uncharacterized protein n=1 Tax=Aspergillus coremiiformis TaxID=138285 RepID=A0A5N6ZBU7_9EURO|nr:hypothetical protein BDV28DRAFT_146423 [Aspergillus coremiiformis]
MSSLLDIPFSRRLETPDPLNTHDPECTASSPSEKILPVPLSHHDHSFILPPSIDFDSIHKPNREPQPPSTTSSRNSPWKSPSLSGIGHEWSSSKAVDKDARSSLQEYCSSFDQVRLLKRGLQRLA